MSDVGVKHPKEYSDRFDTLRQNRVEVSMHKYGSAAVNFGDHLVDALKSHDMCVEKYKQTGNTEYLCDAANYLMFEFMYPTIAGAYFKATDSNDSAGHSGKSVKEYDEDENKTFNRVVGISQFGGSYSC